MTAARTAEARRFPLLFAALALAIYALEFGRAPGPLRVGGNGRPSALLARREPLVARGPYERTKAVTTVALALDEPAAVAASLSG
ncbi:MAG: hypothetical protein B7Z72_13415 [Gemmatimonadetes bacterium 21-71-4]|nr:MAG: hypothetical protein B7Z72_13415 [Gemmatimonadetes bacterium 21-71-4]